MIKGLINKINKHSNIIAGVSLLLMSVMFVCYVGLTKPEIDLFSKTIFELVMIVLNTIPIVVVTYGILFLWVVVSRLLFENIKVYLPHLKKITQKLETTTIIQVLLMLMAGIYFAVQPEPSIAIEYIIGVTFISCLIKVLVDLALRELYLSSEFKVDIQKLNFKDKVIFQLTRHSVITLLIFCVVVSPLTIFYTITSCDELFLIGVQTLAIASMIEQVVCYMTWNIGITGSLTLSNSQKKQKQLNHKMYLILINSAWALSTLLIIFNIIN